MIFRPCDNSSCPEKIIDSGLKSLHHNANTLDIFCQNKLIEIEPNLYLTNTANWVSIVLKVFLVYMYDVIIVQSMNILGSTAATIKCSSAAATCNSTNKIVPLLIYWRSRNIFCRVTRKVKFRRRLFPPFLPVSLNSVPFFIFSQ